VTDSGTPALTANGRLLETYASAIQVAFFDLKDVEPLTLLGDGWDSVVVETAGGVVFRFPKRESVAAGYAKERLLLPFLRGHLTPDIPIAGWEAGSQVDFRWGFHGYEKIAGQALHADVIDEKNVDRLALAIGEFLFELHHFPADRARSFDVPGERVWRESHTALSRAVLPILKRELRIREFATVRRWWRGFLETDRHWDFEPALVHGNLVPEHLLVDRDARNLVGVIDWADAAVADAAIDFVGLIGAYGTDFTWRVVEAYRSRGGSADGGLFARIRRLNAVVPFHAVRKSAVLRAEDEEEEAGEVLTAAVAALRAGPILAS
jgi:aminoglycoside 2''-phosphotransferase